MTKIILLALGIYTSGAIAETPDAILSRYQKEAKQSSSAFQGFSVERGRQLYLQKVATNKGEISCATCHTADPKQVGRTRANKNIEPLAPSVNPKRFTDAATVEKWFARNCDDVFKRPCSPIEKGDFITYLLSVK